jgi:L-asparaginase
MASKVYILYTGGTFGMLKTAEGLTPGNWSSIIDYLPSRNGSTFFDNFKNVSFTFDVLDPPVDSSDINPSQWGAIGDLIREHYQSHDGFIIIHGTDTMAYTASALSFILQGLQKPVILTGAQLPIFHPRTDGVVNLSNAIYLAGHEAFGLPKLPEVMICFNDDLLRGNRTSKVSTNDFEGFDSPNYPNLASLEQEIVVNTNVVLHRKEKELKLLEKFSNKVVNVTVFPGYNPQILTRLIKQKEIKGIVLKTFGSGNLPNDKAWEELVTLCKTHKVQVLATTQCPNGGVDIGKYSASNVLVNEVVTDGKDITSEAALTKLMWVIGNFPADERSSTLRESISGEI